MGTGESVKQVFAYIDKVKEAYSIESYTVTTTTLEDVFLKLNNSSNDIFSNEKNEISNEIVVNTAKISNGIEDIKNKINKIEVSFLSQFKAHFLRYLVTLWRTNILLSQ